MKTNNLVLVTGANGFIGRATVSALADAGWHVTKGVRSTFEPFTDEIVRLDLSDPATILASARDTHFDAIVHLGALVGWSGETESELFVPNVLSTGCLAYLATLWDAHLIFASTAIVHGVRTGAIDADPPICLDTAYANSKWLAEQLLRASQARHCVLRIAGVFGANGPSHLGLNRAIDGAIKGEPPIQIGSGCALRNYVYVKDVAETIIYALREKLEGTYLLAGEDVMPISEMLRAICDTFTSGQHPVVKDGPEAMDQVIQPSSLLPKTRGFREALFDIRNENCL